MVNRRIFVDEPDPPPVPFPSATDAEEEEASTGGIAFDAETPREWGKLIDRGTEIVKNIIVAVRSGEAAKFRREVIKLIEDLRGAAEAATGPPPLSNGATNPSPPSPTAQDQTTTGKEIVKMERRIDLGKLEAEIKKALDLVALAKPSLTAKDLPVMFQENRAAVMKEVAKAIEASMVFIAP